MFRIKPCVSKRLNYCFWLRGGLPGEEGNCFKKCTETAHCDIRPGSTTTTDFRPFRLCPVASTSNRGNPNATVRIRPFHLTNAQYSGSTYRQDQTIWYIYSPFR